MTARCWLTRAGKEGDGPPSRSVAMGVGGEGAWLIVLLRILVFLSAIAIAVGSAGCLATSLPESTTWTGTTSIQGIKRIGEGKVEVVYAIEVKNVGKTSVSSPRAKVVPPSGQAQVIALQGFDGTWYGSVLFVLDEEDLIDFTQDMEFVLLWQEGGANREEPFIKGLGSRASA